jgi:hypothetical protein
VFLISVLKYILILVVTMFQSKYRQFNVHGMPNEVWTCVNEVITCFSLEEVGRLYKPLLYATGSSNIVSQLIKKKSQQGYPSSRHYPFISLSLILCFKYVISGCENNSHSGNQTEKRPCTTDVITVP